MQPQVEGWVQQFFDPTEDDIGRRLDLDVARVARHLAQKLVPPEFHPFEERDRHNLDKLAEAHRPKNTEELDEVLRAEFARTGSLWRVLFKSFERFFTAVQASIRRIVIEEKYGKVRSVEPGLAKARPRRELSENEKRQVMQRDGNKCLCCGATGKGVRLQIDHIVSHAIGGETSIENSQTLCSVCNRLKNINELNFLQTRTLLRSPKPLDLLRGSNREDVKRSLMRLVNLFYHCKAVCEIRMHERRNGQFYTKWEIELFQGNDPKWLSEHKDELLRHIQENFDCPQVTSIRIMAAK